MKLFDWLVQRYIGKAVRLIVDDIYANPERYSIRHNSVIYVYRDGKEYMNLFSSGNINVLHCYYSGVKAGLIRQALIWAMRNGCTVN